MSDDEADPELLELLRQSLGTSSQPKKVSNDTGVLEDAEFIYTNAVDVNIDMQGTKSAAMAIATAMRERNYSTQAWSTHPLHPRIGLGFGEIDMVNFIFTMDLLNFSFWSDLPEEERFCIEYRGKRWTGYNSLVAALRRGLEEGVPITTPRFWRSGDCTDEVLKRVFRSASGEEMPLLRERVRFLRETGDRLHECSGEAEDWSNDETAVDTPATEQSDEADAAVVVDEQAAYLASADGNVGQRASDACQHEQTKSGVANDHPPNFQELHSNPGSGLSQTSSSTAATQEQAKMPGADESVGFGPTEVPAETTNPDMTVIRLVEKAGHSAGKLVNLLGKHIPAFLDETRFEGRRVRLMKRAQIFVADLWAAFNGTSYGDFHDIRHLTMFADYRVPQMLQSLGVLAYSPPLLAKISAHHVLPSGHSWEVQLRGCSIWAVELMRREIVARDATAENSVNAVLIDFFLYDLAKEKEARERNRGE